MSDWRSDITEASFRGVFFHVADATGTAGRRVATHEYPQRDEPYHEDMGREIRDITIEGWLGGDGNSYLPALTELLDAVETAGPGTLVHPLYGELEVVCISCNHTISTAEGGICRLTLTFREAGALLFPAVGASATEAVGTASDGLQSAARLEFLDSFVVSDYPDWVATDAINGVLAQRAQIRLAIMGPGASQIAEAAQLVSALDDLETAVEADVSLVYDPEQLADDLLAIYQLTASLPILRELTTLAGVQSAYAGTQEDEAAAWGNQVALDRYLHRALLGQQAVALAATELAYYQIAVALRDELLARAAAEAELGGSDAAIQGLQDLRVRVAEDIDSRIADLPRLRDHMVAEPTPACVVAYELYGDATRADEITDRNGIPHPGYCSGTLQVLSW